MKEERYTERGASVQTDGLTGGISIHSEIGGRAYTGMQEDRQRDRQMRDENGKAKIETNADQ